MITPRAFAESAAFTAGQQHENRRIGEILRYRRTFAINSQLPQSIRTILLEEIEAIIRAIDEAG